MINTNTNIIKKIIILFISYVILFIYDWESLIAIIVLSTITFFLGRALGSNISTQLKKIILSISIILAIILLLVYKIIVKKVPFGMSFYILSIISYLIDVYRGDFVSDTNILDLLLFIGFIPKLTCGPITRPSELIPQFTKGGKINKDMVSEGIQIFVFGVFQKFVLADHIAAYINEIYNHIDAYNSTVIWFAVFGYSAQILLDFSGYSDMAIGISKILGYELPNNFDYPYLSDRFSVFWSRWHISFSRWLKDYVYIPLGGSKKSTIRRDINLLITMLISAAWHGTGITYIIWGGGMHFVPLLNIIKETFSKNTK